MRIAYVEDNPTNLALVERIAKMTKHNVVAYSEGEVALESLKAEPFDLILMDVELAGELNGLEVVRRLRAHGLKTPIVAVTAYAMMGDRDRCLALGCDDYLPKPLPINDFISLLARYDAIVKSGASAGPVPVTIPGVTPAAPVAPVAAQPATPAPTAAQPAAPVTTPAATQPVAPVSIPAAVQPATPAPIAAQPAAPVAAPSVAQPTPPAAVQPVTATPPVSPVAETPAAPVAAPAPETPGTSPSSALPVTQPNVVSSAASSSTMSQPQPVVPSENAPVNPTQPPSAIDVSADKGGSEARLSI